VPAVCAYQAHVLEFYFHCQDAFLGQAPPLYAV
jgi:hypothetical protein